MPFHKAMRKLSLERESPPSSSKASHGNETSAVEEPPRSLPIADQFKRSLPAMPPLLSKTNKDRDHERDAHYGPFDSEANPAVLEASPVKASIRRVSAQTAEYGNVEPGRERWNVDALVPNFSRLNVESAAYYPTAGDATAVPLDGVDGYAHNTVPRRKPLPKPPISESDSDDNDESPQSEEKKWVARAQTRDLERQLGVEGQIDLSRTEDTEYQTHWAPAVTHETIIQPVHEIEEKRITREIHQDHVFHRILPVEEVEVMPARHYVRDNKGVLREVSEQQIPGRARQHAQQVVAERFQKARPATTPTSGPRAFTAREYRGEEGDYNEFCTQDGYQGSERWWVHAPTLESGGRDGGQTRAFHFGSARPEDDGWRS